MNRILRVAIATLLGALCAGLVLVALPASAQDGGGSGSAGAGGSGGSGADSADAPAPPPSTGNVLRFGWAQEPDNLNPFVGQNEEDFTAWSINWQLPIGFSPEDLSPTSAIIKSWDVSEDRKTVTMHLEPGLKWSDGKPITSEDVRWSLDTLGSEGVLFTSYTDGITKMETPDPETLVVHTKRPDARLVGGLYVYVLPKHIWGKVPMDDLTGQYKPELPMVGSGPYIVTEWEKGRILRMERNPEWQGEPGAYDQIQFFKYGTQDAVERALQLGEIDMIGEVEAGSFARLGSQDSVDAISSPTPAYTQLAFNLCSEQNCPDAEFNPAIQDQTIRQAIAYSVDRNKINEIAARGTSFVANGILPSYYKAFYTEPEQTYPFDPDQANQMLDDAGWTLNDDGIREKDGETASFDVYVRSESPYNIQAAKLIAEMTAEVGIQFNVQVVSTDKLYDLTVRKEDGKPAPAFDTFIWGWGGDPYDPSFLLSILTTGEIGGSSDSFYSNPEYDRLYREQTGLFDTEARKEVIAKMIAITQEDLPYLVLTEDPALQAYRTDRIDKIAPICPAETGDLFCDSVSPQGVIALTPLAGAGSDEVGAGNPGLAAVIGLVVGFIAGVLVTRRRRGAGEPLELPE
ncbi:MAG: peptide ABC transporter substrate-binding protein [Solirubrobacterales bacterium]